jgi:hypothetical protein
MKATRKFLVVALVLVMAVALFGVTARSATAQTTVQSPLNLWASPDAYVLSAFVPKFDVTDHSGNATMRLMAIVKGTSDEGITQLNLLLGMPISQVSNVSAKNWPSTVLNVDVTPVEANTKFTVHFSDTVHTGDEYRVDLTATLANVVEKLGDYSYRMALNVSPKSQTNALTAMYYLPTDITWVTPAFGDPSIEYTPPYVNYTFYDVGANSMVAIDFSFGPDVPTPTEPPPTDVPTREPTVESTAVPTIVPTTDPTAIPTTVVPIDRFIFLPLVIY